MVSTFLKTAPNAFCLLFYCLYLKFGFLLRLQSPSRSRQLAQTPSERKRQITAPSHEIITEEAYQNVLQSGTALPVLLLPLSLLSRRRDLSIHPSIQLSHRRNHRNCPAIDTQARLFRNDYNESAGRIIFRAIPFN